MLCGGMVARGGNFVSDICFVDGKSGFCFIPFFPFCTFETRFRNSTHNFFQLDLRI